MILILGAVNYFMVLLYGIFLNAAFAGVENNKKNRLLLLIFFIFISILQTGLFFVFGDLNKVSKLYPVLVHFPVILYLVFFCRKSWVLAVVSLTSAYMFTTPRRWVGTTLSILFGGDKLVLYLSQILITIPLMWIIIKYIVPPVRNILTSPGRTPLLFSSLPMMYYIFSYSTTVYSSALYSGNPAIAEFLASVMILCYFTFTVLYFYENKQRNEAEENQRIMEITSEQGKKEIEQLRKSQEHAAIYRHDLRHHLRLISACIEQNNGSRALEYIRDTCAEINDTEVIRYCQNETVNLILSSYIGKAKEQQITCEVNAVIGNIVSISNIYMCSILSNALENAINACTRIPEAENRFIKIKAYQKDTKFLIEVRNSFAGQIHFENGLPTTDKKGHGIGIKSITAITKKYRGIYSFEANDGLFVMRVVI